MLQTEAPALFLLTGPSFGGLREALWIIWWWLLSFPLALVFSGWCYHTPQGHSTVEYNTVPMHVDYAQIHFLWSWS
ncbi:hypothetical protein CEXT_108381 [Caerostris extrusa]|uniref:Uncharacterized protein n=1 Tax=Caerostris extrusa TaxID=172846 RepID=A0AAV4SUF3_CAEEX|nr:hypothetical protein CEXT_108381 [Caerostris extrusa]